MQDLNPPEEEEQHFLANKQEDRAFTQLNYRRRVGCCRSISLSNYFLIALLLNLQLLFAANEWKYLLLAYQKEIPALFVMCGMALLAGLILLVLAVKLQEYHRLKSKARVRVLQFFKLYAVLALCLSAALRMVGLSSVLLTITLPVIELAWGVVMLLTAKETLTLVDLQFNLLSHISVVISLCFFTLLGAIQGLRGLLQTALTTSKCREQCQDLQISYNMDCLLACRNSFNFYTLDSIILFGLSLLAGVIILFQVVCCVNETIIPTRRDSEEHSASPASSNNSDQVRNSRLFVSLSCAARHRSLFRQILSRRFFSPVASLILLPLYFSQGPFQLFVSNVLNPTYTCQNIAITPIHLVCDNSFWRGMLALITATSAFLALLISNHCFWTTSSRITRFFSLFFLLTAFFPLIFAFAKQGHFLTFILTTLSYGSTLAYIPALLFILLPKLSSDLYEFVSDHPSHMNSDILIQGIILFWGIILAAFMGCISMLFHVLFQNKLDQSQLILSNDSLSTFQLVTSSIITIAFLSIPMWIVAGLCFCFPVKDDTQLILVHQINLSKQRFYESGSLQSGNIYQNPLTNVELMSPHHPSPLFNQLLCLLPLQAQTFRDINLKEKRASVMQKSTCSVIFLSLFFVLKFAFLVYIAIAPPRRMGLHCLGTGIFCIIFARTIPEFWVQLNILRNLKLYNKSEHRTKQHIGVQDARAAMKYYDRLNRHNLLLYN